MIKKIHRIFVRQYGIDFPFFWRGLRLTPRFFRDYIKFRKSYNGEIELQPFLHDSTQEGGSTRNEYFWQDLFVARLIFGAAPDKHVDIGSRVDGFVSHVASYRSIEVFDVRPIKAVVPGVIFKKADLMDLASLPLSGSDGYCDSLSCLHALEHFGLGRYGDPINPSGYKLGLFNMTRLLKKSGLFYLSIPIGRERVEFNANWIFDPRAIVNIANEVRLKLVNFHLIYSDQPPKEVSVHKDSFELLAYEDYNLGLFIFRKEA